MLSTEQFTQCFIFEIVSNFFVDLCPLKFEFHLYHLVPTVVSSFLKLFFRGGTLFPYTVPRTLLIRLLSLLEDTSSLLKIVLSAP